MARICMVLTTTPWNDFRQFYRQAPALADGGHEVIYLAAGPGHKVTDRFTFSPLTPRQRRMAQLTGGLNLVRRIVSLRPAAVQLCSVEQLPLGLALKSATGIKVVYDCREDMYHSMLHKVQYPRWQRQILAWGTLALERLAARTFDGLVASDPAIYEMHSAIPPDRKMLFYNVPHLRAFTRRYPPLAQRKHDVVVMGSMSPRTGVVTVIEAAGLLKQRNRRIRVLLLGQPDAEVDVTIKRLTEKFGIADHVTTTGWVDHKEVPELLGQAKVGVVPLLNMAKFRNNIACKAFEYLACGMPAVCTDLPPQRLFIRNGENGLFYEPGDAEALAEAIASLLDDLPRAQTLGQTGRKDVEREWNAERFEEQYRTFYDAIIARPRRGR